MVSDACAFIELCISVHMHEWFPLCCIQNMGYPQTLQPHNVLGYEPAWQEVSRKWLEFGEASQYLGIDNQTLFLSIDAKYTVPKSETLQVINAQKYSEPWSLPVHESFLGWQLRKAHMKVNLHLLDPTVA